MPERASPILEGYAGASIGGAPSAGSPNGRRATETTVRRGRPGRYRTGAGGRLRSTDRARDLDVRQREPVPDAAVATRRGSRDRADRDGPTGRPRRPGGAPRPGRPAVLRAGNRRAAPALAGARIARR